MMKRIGAAFLALVLFSACSKRADPALLNFTYWGEIDEFHIIKELLGDFEKLHPEIKINNQRVAAGGPAYDQKLLTLFSAGLGPDVFLVSSWNAKKYVQAGVLADLSKNARESRNLDHGQFYPEIVRDFTVDGKLYVVARDIAPVACLYYNKKAFDQAGVAYPKDDWTWPEPFASVAQKLVRKDAAGNVTQWGYLDDWAQLYDTFVYSAGGHYFDDDRAPKAMAIDSPQAIAGFQFRADLINKYRVMPRASSMSQVGGSPSDWFTTQKVAMFYSGSWKIPEFRRIKDFDWDITLIPRNSRTLKRAYQGGGSGYAIKAGLSPERFEKAWKLVEFFTSAKTQERFAQTGLLQPSNKRVAQGKAFLDGQTPKNKQILVRAIRDTYPKPDTDRFDEILSGGIDPFLSDLWNGKRSAEEVLKAAVPVLNQRYFAKEAGR